MSIVDLHSWSKWDTVVICGREGADERAQWHTSCSSLASSNLGLARSEDNAIK